MPPQGITTHLLTLAETVGLLLASRLTPDSIRQLLLKFTRELEDILPPESKKDVESIKARAVIRAVAHRRDDD